MQGMRGLRHILAAAARHVHEGYKGALSALLQCETEASRRHQQLQRNRKLLLQCAKILWGRDKGGSDSAAHVSSAGRRSRMRTAMVGALPDTELHDMHGRRDGRQEGQSQSCAVTAAQGPGQLLCCCCMATCTQPVLSCLSQPNCRAAFGRPVTRMPCLLLGLLEGRCVKASRFEAEGERDGITRHGALYQEAFVIAWNCDRIFFPLVPQSVT